MRKTLWLAGIAILGLALFFLRLRETPRSDGLEAPSGPPHVIVYLIDTLRADHLGSYGYARETSRVLDGLAAEGVLFENAFAQSSWTKASVGSLFTGLFPSRHGAVRRDHRLRDDVLTLAELLQQHGYQTAAFLSNPNVLPIFGFDRGFGDVFDIESISRGGTADEVHAAVYEYLDQRVEGDDTPLFLYIHSRDPHGPYDPPPPFQERFPVRSAPSDAGYHLEEMLAAYDGEIAFNDHEIQSLLERLRRAGIYENAVIAVMSDHGEEFLDHGSWSHGQTLYEEQLRVPMIIRLPGAQRAGSRIREPIRVIDFLPTLAAFLNLELTDEIDGQSFLPLLLGQDATSYTPTFFSELNLDGRVIRSLTRGRFKLIDQRLPLSEAGLKLYDLSEDSGEQNDLSKKEQVLGRALHEHLAHIESTLNGGTHVAISNAVGLETVHATRGRLRAIDGSFSNVINSSLEAGDEVKLNPERDLIEFSLDLRNHGNPLGQNPAVIVDVDRFQFSMEPTDARFQLEIEFDGQPLDPEELRLGRSLVAPRAELPFVTRALDPRIQIASGALPRSLGGSRPNCRVYSVLQLREDSVEVDAELDARLRALGYLGE
jgi:arylsulfatase A-like enzyme